MRVVVALGAVLQQHEHVSAPQGTAEVGLPFGRILSVPLVPAAGLRPGLEDLHVAAGDILPGVVLPRDAEDTAVRVDPAEAAVQPAADGVQQPWPEAQLLGVPLAVQRCHGSEASARLRARTGPDGTTPGPGFIERRRLSWKSRGEMKLKPLRWEGAAGRVRVRSCGVRGYRFGTATLDPSRPSAVRRRRWGYPHYAARVEGRPGTLPAGLSDSAPTCSLRAGKSSGL